MSTKEERDRAFITGWLADHDIVCGDKLAEAVRVLLDLEVKAARQSTIAQAHNRVLEQNAATFAKLAEDGE